MTEQTNGEMLRASKDFFRRYTKLEFALHALRDGFLQLRNVAGWEDKNDKRCIEEYTKRLRYHDVLALCVTDGLERYHHWTGYDGRDQLCCIVFKKQSLKESYKLSKETYRSLRFQKVHYLSLSAAKKGALIPSLPYRKLSAYRAEQEWRFIHPRMDCESEAARVLISPAMVDCIVLNPWVDEKVLDDSRKLVQEVSGFEKIEVKRSLIIENEQWLESMLKASPPKP